MEIKVKTEMYNSGAHRHIVSVPELEWIVKIDVWGKRITISQINGPALLGTRGGHLALWTAMLAKADELIQTEEAAQAGK